MNDCGHPANLTKRTTARIAYYNVANLFRILCSLPGSFYSDNLHGTLNHLFSHALEDN
jgi:hypothetical protein